jgi:hypothetical protein
MNGLNQVGVAREGLQRRCLVGLKERGHVVLLFIQGGKLKPRGRVFEVAPDPLDRVQLGTIEGQAHEAHIFRQGEPLGGMRTTIVEEQEMQAVRKSRGEGVDEDLEGFPVQIGQFQEKPLAAGGRHGAIDVEPRKDVLDCADRLHAVGGEAPAAAGQDAEAAFVLAEHPDGPKIGRWNGLLEAGRTGGLEGGNGRRLFLCDWGAAL